MGRNGKGLSCNLDHWHHPYWRFHFDLYRNQSQQVNLFNDAYLKETVHQERELHNEDIGRSPRYNIENLKKKGNMWVIPPLIDPTEGIVSSTDFARWDAVVSTFWGYTFQETKPCS